MDSSRSRTNIAEDRARTKARVYAALHCTKYKKCLDRACKNGSPIHCINCRRYENIINNYQKGIPSSTITSNNINPLIDRFPLRVPK